MEVKFTVPGPPKGKQRPRICRINGRNIVYTPKQTVNYERQIKAAYSAASSFKFERSIPLEVTIVALFEPPKSANQNLRSLMLSGDILPTKRPDCDNLIKVVLDALNDLAYHDDCQICRVYLVKMYAKTPGIRVLIKNIVE